MKAVLLARLEESLESEGGGGGEDGAGEDAAPEEEQQKEMEEEEKEVSEKEATPEPESAPAPAAAPARAAPAQTTKQHEKPNAAATEEGELTKAQKDELKKKKREEWKAKQKAEYEAREAKRQAKKAEENKQFIETLEERKQRAAKFNGPFILSDAEKQRVEQARRTFVAFVLTRALSSNCSRPSSVARRLFESRRKGRLRPTRSRDARASEIQLVISGIDDVSQLDVASTRAPTLRPRRPDSPTPALTIEFNSEIVPEPRRTAIIWVSARPTPRSRTLAKLTMVQTRSRTPSRSSPSPRARNGNAIAAEATGASWAAAFHKVFRPILWLLMFF